MSRQGLVPKNETEFRKEEYSSRSPCLLSAGSRLFVALVGPPVEPVVLQWSAMRIWSCPSQVMGIAPWPVHGLPDLDASWTLLACLIDAFCGVPMGEELWGSWDLSSPVASGWGQG